MVDRLVHSEVNARRVAMVEQSFGRMGEPLSAFGRVLVGEGVLIKMCRKKAKQRQFFLFNDKLVYGNIVISKKRYNKQRIIDLEGVELEDISDEDSVLRNGWNIKTPAKSFAVFAATATEKKEWMIHIERCVNDLIEKGKKRPLGKTAAVWVPDGEAARCMACGRTQFNVLHRRHHCRNCGKVVCGQCSTRSYRIASLGKKNPSRVCDACFTQLTGVAGDSVSVGGSVGSPRDNSDSSSDSDEEKADENHTATFYSEES